MGLATLERPALRTQHAWLCRHPTAATLLARSPLPVQAVTCLAFSDSGSVLVTGGEDTLVNAWLLADVLDATAGQQLQVRGAGRRLLPVEY